MRLHPHSVLVVDDTLENIQVLGELLEIDGYEVRVCTTGAKALELAQASHPDLILLDVMMPGMDGLEVCRKLKGNPETAAIPVIFLTGLAHEVTQIDSLELGAVDYITKPYHLGVVRKRVQLQLALHDLQKDLVEQNEKLEHLVAKRTQELIEANQRLTQQDWTKATYLRLLSQELKGPTNGLIGITQLALSNMSDETKKKRFQTLADEIKGRLEETFSNCETLTRFQGAGERIALHPVRLKDVLAAATSRLSAFEGDHAQAIPKFKDPSCIVQGDQGILIQAFTSLLHFVVLVSKEPPIQVTIRDQEPWTTVEITASTDGGNLLLSSLDDLALVEGFSDALETLGLNLPLAGVIIEAIGGRVVLSQRNAGALFLSVVLKKYSTK